MTLKASQNTQPRRPGYQPIRAAGSFFSANETSYFDASSQTVNLLLGQCDPGLGRAIKNILETYTFIDQDFPTELDTMAYRELEKVLPHGLDVVNLKLSNATDAVECAVKQARVATGRPRIVTLEGIYLGQSTQAIHLRGWGVRRDEVLIGSRESVSFLPMPRELTDSSAKNLIESHERLLDEWCSNSGDVAALVLDPLMLSSGLGGLPGGVAYVKKMQEICTRHGIALIIDESQTFGWHPNGTWCRAHSICPDAIVVGKGIAASLPIAICASKGWMDKLSWGDADYTNGGHPVCVSALIETCNRVSLKSTQKHLGDLISVTDYVLERAGLAHRGLGLAQLIQVDSSSRVLCPATPRAVNVSEKLMGEGVYIRAYGNCLGWKPPITTDRTSLEIALESVASAITG